MLIFHSRNAVDAKMAPGGDDGYVLLQKQVEIRITGAWINHDGAVNFLKDLLNRRTEGFICAWNEQKCISHLCSSGRKPVQLFHKIRIADQRIAAKREEDPENHRAPFRKALRHAVGAIIYFPGDIQYVLAGFSGNRSLAGKNMRNGGNGHAGSFSYFVNAQSDQCLPVKVIKALCGLNYNL